MADPRDRGRRVAPVRRPEAVDARRPRQRPRRAGSQLWSKPTSYDEYRGVLRIMRPSAVGTDRDRRQRAAARARTCAASSRPRCRRAGRPRRSRPRRSPRARTRPGASGRASRTTTSSTTSRSQVYRGALGERATTNAIVRATAGIVLRSGSAIANTLYHSAGGGGDREQRERLHLGRPAPRSPARSATCAARRDRDGRRHVLRRRRAVRHLGDGDLHRRAAVGLVRGRRADERRHAHGARPAQTAASRAGSSA